MHLYFSLLSVCGYLVHRCFFTAFVFVMSFCILAICDINAHPYTSNHQELLLGLCVYFWILIWTSVFYWWFHQYIQMTCMNLQLGFHQWDHWNCTFFSSSIFYWLIQQLLLNKVDKPLTLWLSKPWWLSTTFSIFLVLEFNTL